MQARSGPPPSPSPPASGRVLGVLAVLVIAWPAMGGTGSALARQPPAPAASPGNAPDGSDLQPVTVSDGVTIYRRKASPIVDLVAEGEIEAPPGQVRAVLLDYARHPRFVRGLIVSRILSTEPRRLRVYQ